MWFLFGIFFIDFDYSSHDAQDHTVRGGGRGGRRTSTGVRSLSADNGARVQRVRRHGGTADFAGGQQFFAAGRDGRSASRRKF